MKEKIMFELIEFSNSPKKLFEEYPFFKNMSKHFECVLVKKYKDEIDYSVAFFPCLSDALEITRALSTLGYKILTDLKY